MTSVRTRGDTTQFPTLHSTHVKARCAAVIAAWVVIAPAPSLAAEAKPDAPTSIDSLFGDAVAKEPARDDVKLNGYVSSELAYTFASPAHWSRMLVRGQVDATGSFSENVKWKLSGRFTAEDTVTATVSGTATIRKGSRVISRCETAKPTSVRLAVRR